MKVWFSLVFGLFYATVLKLLAKARHLPVSSLDFCVGQRTDGKHVSGLFAIPGFGTECLKIDWLHCVDLGLSCDYIASLFWYIIMTKIDGATKHIRCSKLFAEIKKFYEANNSDTRLPKLVPGMLRAEQKGKLKSPKLRAKAGETRCLIPCQLLLAKKFLDASQPQEHTMILASEHLAAMYACLSAWDPEAFARSSQKFLLLLAALETNFLQSKMFRVKPKSHQIVELSRNGTNPICTWNYRDESFGHYLATLAKRRGGTFSLQAVASSCLLRFLAANHLPVLEGQV